MKRNRLLCRTLCRVGVGAIGLPLLFATSSLAADLENRDGQAYQVTVMQSSSTSTVTVESGTVVSGICTSACQVDVEGIGSVNLAAQDRLVIENGTLTIANPINL